VIGRAQQQGFRQAVAEEPALKEAADLKTVMPVGERVILESLIGS
jgi:hypothetical protein